MMEVLAGLGVAFAVAGALTPAVRAAARRYGLVVAPRQDRWHTTPTALYGGVGIMLGAAAGWAVLATRGLADHSPALAIIAAAAVLFVVGVVDDARGIGPVGKFILQLVPATLLIAVGVVYPLTPWNPVNVLVTLFWFVGITNALNLLDNMDGVSAGVSAVAAAGFALLFAAAGDLVLAGVSLAVAGAAAGFLIYNFKPASIFMGDAGSLFLGAALAGLGAAYPLANARAGPIAVLVPALVLLIPIVDTTLVTVARTLHNRRISVGGRDHTTHRLVAMGFPEGRVALFLYLCGAAAVAVAWLAAHAYPPAGVWMVLLFLTVALVFTGYLGTLYRYDDRAPAEATRRGLVLRHVLLKRRGLVVLLDVFLFGAAYYGAYVVYYEAGMPAAIGRIANATLGAVIVLKLIAFHYFRVYRTVWDQSTLPDVHRIGRATVLGSLLVIGALFLMARAEHIPRTVFLLDFLLTGLLAVGARMSFRSLDRYRQRLQPGAGEPTLILGTRTGEADLAVRAIARRPDLGLRPVGFVDVDPELVGGLLHGLPVIGMADLPSFIREAGVRVVVISGADVAASTIEDFAKSGVQVVRFKADFVPDFAAAPALSIRPAASAAGRQMASRERAEAGLG